MNFRTVTAHNPDSFNEQVAFAARALAEDWEHVEVQFSTALAYSSYGTVKVFSALLIGRDR